MCLCFSILFFPFLVEIKLKALVVKHNLLEFFLLKLWKEIIAQNVLIVFK